ncbi:MAG: glycosyltransferase family 39 protein [Candidatus Chisholmbacteria bacterium]|nr:glycosyltransferase family 39 protein [Candidatus Chisholmbacteria bacterium]
MWEGWLRNWDEAWYAEIIKNMAVKDYGWLMPWWNGRYYFDHPPLYFWLSSMVVKLFGLGEWQVRIVAVVAGLGVVWLTYILGKRLFSRRAGIGASLMVVSLAQVIVRFSHGNLDSLMIFLFLLTFYLWFRQKPGWAGITLGLGFLVKGWLVGLFPIVWIGIYEGVVKKRLPVKRMMRVMLIGTGVFLAWVIPAAIRFGKPVVDRYLLMPEAGRLSRPEAMWSLKFFEYLVRDVGLWVIPGLILVLKPKWVEANKRRTMAILLLVSFGFIFSLNFLDEKSDWYLLPVYPLLALVIGYLSSRWNKVAVTMLVIVGLVNAYRVEMIYPDRSAVGAELGRYARKVIPRGETVVLDDHDFTAFLFYSDAGMVYVPSPGGGKPGEWWMLGYDELTKLVAEKAPVWIVTPNLNNLPEELRVKETAEYKGYKFLRAWGGFSDSGR